jgi:hypothetical protein
MVSTTNYTPGPLLANGLYYWHVRTLNYLNVPGPWSTTWSFTIDTVAPPTPALIAPANNSASTLTKPVFSWGTVVGAVRYEMALGTTNPPAVTVSNSVLTSFTPPSPLLYSWYYWRVRAIDAAGNISAWSATWAVHIMSPTLDYPVLNRYITHTPTLTWTLITWATAYQIQIDDNANFSSPIYTSALDTSGTLSHTVQVPLPNGTWYWRIRAFNSAGAPGPWSPAGTFTVES